MADIAGGIGFPPAQAPMQDPPSTPRKVNYYGHFRRAAQARRYRVNMAHAAALLEDAARERAAIRPAMLALAEDLPPDARLWYPDGTPCPRDASA